MEQNRRTFLGAIGAAVTAFLGSKKLVAGKASDGLTTGHVTTVNQPFGCALKPPFYNMWVPTVGNMSNPAWALAEARKVQADYARATAFTEDIKCRVATVTVDTITYW